MNTLHGLWNDSFLYLWGEEPRQARGAVMKRRIAARKAASAPHPFALDPEGLRATAEALLDALPSTGAVAAEMTLLLPSRGTRPLPGLELSGDDTTPGADPVRLAAWRVPCLRCPPAGALRLLAALPARADTGVAICASLRYWGEAAKLGLELLAQQRFVPDVETEGDGRLRAVWRPLLDEGDVPERLRALLAAMPPVCRAVAGDGPPPQPATLVTGFLTSIVDATVRQGPGGAASKVGARRRKAAPPSLPEQWRAALASEDGRFVAPAAQVEVFARQLRDWLGNLRAATAETPLRTCFRLQPPEGPAEADGEPPRARPSTWTLSFHLQATDDRSLLIEASTVWKERTGVLTFLKRRFENPQERLLADLGRASRLFPPLEEGLRSPRPTACRLSTEQAYTFLKEAAPLLEQSGMGVLLPSWWQKPAARLGVRLRVRAPKQKKGSGSGLLGLDSLVEVDWEAAMGDQRLSMEELERLAALKVPLVQVRGQWVEVHPEQIEAALRFFQRHDGMTLAEAMRLGLGGDGADVGLPIAGVEAEGWIGDVLGDLAGGARLKELPPPRRLHGTLRPYQTRGYSWLAFLDRFGLGACLADDMGLGKTVQLIALLLHERSGRARPGPTLLIAPMSVIGNWQHELTRFAPSLRVLAHHGPERTVGPTFAEEARDHDVVLTTYALASRDRETLSAVAWERVALDEAQNIKNPSAKQTQAVRSLRAPRRIALTGTPVENRLSELWSIMEFLNPGYLGSGAEFRRRFALPIEKYRDADRAEALRRLVQPFVLRRVKTDPAVIQDLPEKLEMKVFCTLTREQASLYEAVVKDMLEQIRTAEGVQRKGLVLATLLRLKQVCNHPSQFLQDGSPLPGRSGKVARLTEMLEEALSAGDRALVFTQFAEMGRMLTQFLQAELGEEVLFLHGGTPKAARDTMVQRFQAEDHAPPIFILSLKAGGLGLNLTAANHVFHFDRWWNPAVENQATDRAFRIGQHKNVQVHKYICAGTVEERIDLMIEQKKDLAQRIVGTGEEWITEMTTDQLRDLFALSREAVGEA